MEALQRLLKEHEQSLIQLYSSLGAQDVVTGKMQELHSALIDTIQRQKSEAEHEVEGVKSELRALKEELRSLAKMLGAKLADDLPSDSLLVTLENRRKALQALKELHAERLVMFTQVFQQLYTFLPVLDLTFFQADLAIPPPDASVEPDNLTLVRHKQLEAEVQRCREEVESRQKQLLEHIEELALLYQDLAIEPPDSVLPLLSDPSPAPSAANLDLIATSLRSLDSERVERESRIQVIYDQLYSLWMKLDVPEDYSEEFVEAHAGISSECIAAYEEELTRMEAIKRENMAVWLEREKDEIARLRQILFLLPDDEMVLDEAMDEEALEQLELEKQRLQQEFMDKEPVLGVLSKYFTLLQESRDLQASANDPSRLTGKGVRGDPGRLLREEKLRKRIAKEKPKAQLETELQKILPRWENEHGQPFLVNGSRFLDDLTERLAQENAGKRVGMGRSKTPTTGAIRPQMTGSSVSNMSATGSHLKRPTSALKTASPIKKQRVNVPASTIGAPIQTGRNPLPANWGKPTAPGPTLAPPPNILHPGRKSYKPRPSSVALSVAPSSLFGHGGTRTVSSASSVWEEEKA